jgi:ribose transport system permease protein
MKTLGRAITVLPPASLVLLALVSVLTLTAPRFASADNLLNVGKVGAVLMLVALGQTVVIMTAGIDLSMGSVVGIVSVVAVLAAGHHGAPVAYALGFASALAVGAINGVLVAYFGTPPFLATLGTLTATHGIASTLVGGIPVHAPPGGGFDTLATGTVLGLPVAVVIAGGAALVVYAVLRWTTFGRRVGLVGASMPAARAAAVPIRTTIFWAYVTAGALVGLAAIVLTSRVQSGQPNLSPSLAYQAIAACAIGGVPLTGGRASIPGVVSGVLVVSVVSNGLVLFNLSSDLQLVAVGGVTVAAVLLQSVRLTRRRVPPDPVEPPVARTRELAGRMP